MRMTHSETKVDDESRNNEAHEATKGLRTETPKQSENMRGKLEMYAKLRHDLRTPLNAVIGYTEMLLEDAEQDSSQSTNQELQEICTAAHQLLEIINTSFDHSELEAGRIDPSSPAFIAELHRRVQSPLATVLNRCEALLRRAGVASEDSATEDLQRILSSANYFATMVADLAETPAEVAVTGGAGRASSAKSYALRTEAASTEDDQSSILIVDDNEINRDLLRRHLERMGHRVTEAENGREALDLLEKSTFDMMLLDIMMPVMDGYQVLEHLKSRNLWRDMPVVVVSALNEMEPVIRCIEQGADDYLSKPLDPVLLRARVNACLEKKRLRDHEVEHLRNLARLNEIGIALSSVLDLDQLLSTILSYSRELTAADGGSIYLVENAGQLTSMERESIRDQKLRFIYSQNDSIDFPFSEFTVSVDEKSISGYAALTCEVLNIEDVYHITPDRPYSFNRSFDEANGYRSQSMLTVPMLTRKSEIIGVLQLVNRKPSAGLILETPAFTEETVLPFDANCVEIIKSLASQAAVSLENAQLYENIERLFEGFVRASVMAIEARDPTTSGHSERVAVLTMGLAEGLNNTNTGPYADMVFSREELREIRYAGLLHDFGKIGVHENVLLKAEKLYPDVKNQITGRFAFIKRDLEARAFEARLEAFRSLSRPEAEARENAILAKLAEDLERLDSYLQVILEANIPSVLEGETVEALREISDRQYIDPKGQSLPYLQPYELSDLSIARGSLNEEERREIESHVTHSFEFLVKIPWTKDLHQVPEIAYGHHEKLNGAGYPKNLSSDEIPLPAKMMAIADIFDALTAADRPYKKAMSVERALDILGYEVKDNHLDAELVRIFTEAKIYENVPAGQAD